MAINSLINCMNYQDHLVGSDTATCVKSVLKISPPHHNPGFDEFHNLALRN